MKVQDMAQNLYSDTRGQSERPVTFTEAVIDGLAAAAVCTCPNASPSFPSTRSERWPSCRTPSARRASIGRSTWICLPKRRSAYGPGLRRQLRRRAHLPHHVAFGRHPRAGAMARPHERVQGHGAAVPAAFLLRKRRPAARAGQARPRLPHPGSHLGRHGQSRARGLPRRGRRVHRRHVPRRRRERHPVQTDGRSGRNAGMGRARKLRRLPDGREKRVRRRGLCEEAAGRAPHRSFQRELHQLGAPHAT